MVTTTSTLHASQVISAAFSSQHDHPSCRLLLKNIPIQHCRKFCQMWRAAGELPAHSWWSSHFLKKLFLFLFFFNVAELHVYCFMVFLLLIAFVKLASLKYFEKSNWYFSQIYILFSSPGGKEQWGENITQKSMKISICEFTVFHI